MRAVSVHEDAIVVTSLIWQTNAVALRAGDEAMLIDSPVFPDELELLPTVLAQAGFEPSALLATHGDWDHLLGRLAFPELALGVAESTAMRLREHPGEPQRELRASDAEHYLKRPRPLSLGAVEALPVPGKLGLGEHELELHPADGHSQDGMAIHAPWMGLLACGDYLSDVEIPVIARAGSLEDYRATLAVLARLVERAAVVVPGHGSAHDRETALRLLDEDVDYLDALEEGRERVRLPEGRDTPRQRAIHGDNLRQGAPITER
jgi:glyoxylase-like metal-dependent hydrolase (beta-lactamase superfamily II)